MHSNITYDDLKSSELQDALIIELLGFNQEEAASIESLTYRQTVAPNLFLAAYHTKPGETQKVLIGYICSLRGPTPYSTISITEHDPIGSAVCIHSVCLHPDYRGKGLGVAMVKEYLRRLDSQSSDQGFQQALLICHRNLIPFYEKCGFVWRGKSAVEHGNYLDWQEMVKEFTE